MKIIITTFLSLLLSVGMYAQSNYKKGYIITNNNDSIIGLIDFKTDKVNATICKFKADEGALEQVFYPGDIAKFRFINEGKYYLSHEVVVEKTVRKVFLEYLVQGMMDLYYYIDTDTNSEYYFFEDDNKQLTIISQNKAQIIGSKNRQDNRYKGVLGSVFSEQPAMTESVKNTKFEREGMVELAQEYHDLACTTGDNCIVFKNNYKEKFTKVSLSVYGGVQYAHYNVDPLEEFQALRGRGLKSKKMLAPTIGGLLNVSDERFSKSFSLYLDASFSGIKSDNEYFIYDTDYSYKTSALTASLEAGIRYTYSKGKLRPAIEAGYGVSYLFNISQRLSSSNYVNSDITIVRDDLYTGSLKNVLGYYNLGIGADYMLVGGNSVFCRISYNRYSFVNGKLDLFKLKLGYTF